MPPQQQAYVQAAQSVGFAMDAVTLMTMNMGGTDPVKDSQTAVLGGAAQLEKIYSLPSGAGIKKMGMLPSIGVDNDKQVIDLKGITTRGSHRSHHSHHALIFSEHPVAQFVSAQGMSSISYWSFNRDFPGNDPSGAQSLNFASSPDQTSPAQFFTTISGALNNVNTAQSAPAVSSNVPPVAAAGVQGVPNPASPPSSSSIVVPPPSNSHPGQKPSLPSPTAR
jgi:hypothetical protein